MSAAASTPHRWKFFRAGGFDQVRLDSAADLEALGSLDQKLWVALACPTSGLELEPRTLELVDSDGDGRIRAPELMASAKWMCGLLVTPDALLAGEGVLPLASLRDDVPEASSLKAAAQSVLKGLGKPEAVALSVDDATAAGKAFEQMPFNGDGVLHEAAVADVALRQALKDAMACVGLAVDRSGQPGITRAHLDDFFKQVHGYDAWRERGRVEPALRPMGEDTGLAAESLRAVHAKIDDYFARCRLAAFDGRATAVLNRDEKDYVAVALGTLTSSGDEVAGFPLARVEANRPLPLRSGLNPAWRERMGLFVSRVVTPLLGPQEALSETEWLDLAAKFHAHDAWWKARQVGAVDRLGEARIHELATSNAEAGLRALVLEDLSLEPLFQSLRSLERAVRLHRDFYRLCNNFVAFRDFYTRSEKAIFQAGTLYLDQRSCELCIRVEDLAKHAALAQLSRTYLVYCECVRRASGEKRTIVAAFTNGDSDNLMVGRNGVFYDCQGRDWDATIVKIVDHPISVRQAFFSPYKRFVRFIEEQVSKRAVTAESSANERLTGTATTVLSAADTGKAPVEKPRLDVGVVAALGVAVGGLTAALGALLQAFFGLGFWMPLGLLALMLVISGPSVLIAWLKLRQRNLGPLLDANGWAVNANARMNVPFGTALTRLATLPPGASRDLRDPYADKNSPWRARLVLLAGAALLFVWYLGKLDSLLPLPARSYSVLKTYAPAYVPPDAPPATKASGP